MADEGYTSSIDRLRDLPVVFSGRELTLRYGWSSSQASQYLYRWCNQKLVKRLGGKSDAYFNLILDPHWERHVQEALKLVYPSAVMIGRRPLYEAGWVSQRAYCVDIAVPDTAIKHDLDPIADVHRRPAEWFRAIPQQRVEHNRLRALPASWALADMQQFQDPLPPDIDDIYWDHLDTREADSYKAAKSAFEVVTPIRESRHVKRRSGAKPA